MSTMDAILTPQERREADLLGAVAWLHSQLTEAAAYMGHRRDCAGDAACTCDYPRVRAQVHRTVQDYAPATFRRPEVPV